MQIHALDNSNFKGLYKIDKRYIKENTRNFFQNNTSIVTQGEDNEDDLFVLTSKDSENEFEQSIKDDKGKYWKSVQLSDLMKYPLFLDAIYHCNAVNNNYKENWVDYTEK